MFYGSHLLLIFLGQRYFTGDECLRGQSSVKYPKSNLYWNQNEFRTWAYTFTATTCCACLISKPEIFSLHPSIFSLQVPCARGRLIFSFIASCNFKENLSSIFIGVFQRGKRDYYYFFVIGQKHSLWKNNRLCFLSCVCRIPISLPRGPVVLHFVFEHGSAFSVSPRCTANRLVWNKQFNFLNMKK